MPVTRMSLIDEALQRIGASPKQIDDGADGDAEKCARIYETTLADLTSKHPWRHSNQMVQLIDEPDQKRPNWDHAYILPSNMEGVPYAVYDDIDIPRINKIYELGLNHIHTNADLCWIVFQRNDAPARFWPGYFRELLILALCSKYAIAVREDGPLSDRYKSQAFGTPSQNGRGGQFATAATRDSSGDPGHVLEMADGPLVSVRR